MPVSYSSQQQTPIDYREWLAMIQQEDPAFNPAMPTADVAGGMNRLMKSIKAMQFMNQMSAEDKRRFDLEYGNRTKALDANIKQTDPTMRMNTAKEFGLDDPTTLGHVGFGDANMPTEFPPSIAAQADELVKASRAMGQDMTYEAAVEYLTGVTKARGQGSAAASYRSTTGAKGNAQAQLDYLEKNKQELIDNLGEEEYYRMVKNATSIGATLPGAGQRLTKGQDKAMAQAAIDNIKKALDFAAAQQDALTEVDLKTKKRVVRKQTKEDKKVGRDPQMDHNAWGMRYDNLYDLAVEIQNALDAANKAGKDFTIPVDVMLLIKKLKAKTDPEKLALEESLKSWIEDLRIGLASEGAGPVAGINPEQAADAVGVIK